MTLTQAKKLKTGDIFRRPSSNSHDVTGYRFYTVSDTDANGFRFVDAHGYHGAIQFATYDKAFMADAYQTDTLNKLGNWTDDPCFYVSIIDGERKALVAGPFITHEDALSAVDASRKLGASVDPKSHFYGWGTAKAPNGYREGTLNAVLSITHPSLNSGRW